MVTTTKTESWETNAKVAVNWISRILSILAMIMIVSFFCVVLIGLVRFLKPSVTKGFHACKQCGVEYKCRNVAAAEQTLHQEQNNMLSRPRNRGIGVFKRRTVNLGKMPLEITDMEPPKCCTSGATNEQFCDFPCYLKFVAIQKYQTQQEHRGQEQQA